MGLERAVVLLSQIVHNLQPEPVFSQQIVVFFVGIGIICSGIPALYGKIVPMN